MTAAEGMIINKRLIQFFLCLRDCRPSAREKALQAQEP